MRNTFLLLLTFTLFAGRVAGQCTLNITNPDPVCFPSTVNLKDAAITAGSSAGLTYTYWTDVLATIAYGTPTAATAGTYYIKGDDGAGCTPIKPVVVTVTTPATAIISYAGTPFCVSLSSPQPVTISGTDTYTGGIYSSTAGLTINAGNGAITPSSSTAGTYTVTYTIPASGGCPAIPVTTPVTIVGIPAVPVVGAITQPTCTSSTGSVAFSGLPSFSDWTITASPGGVSATGTGLTGTLPGLLPGTYTFRVSNYANCTSGPTGSTIIQAQPTTPTAPVVGSITPPTCTIATGSVVLSGLPGTGTWELRRYPGGVVTPGSGSSITLSGLTAGTYNYSVTNVAGCVSNSLSNNVVIPAQPVTPSAPVIGNIDQPTCTIATGSVALSGLPSGNWIVTINPGGTIYPGTTATTVITGIAAGTYTFTVTASNTCTSPASSPAVINAAPPTPTAPQIGLITQPTCAVSTGSITLNSLPAGAWVLTRNPGSVTTAGSTTSITVANLDPGTYTFSITNSFGCISPASANAVINPRPPAPGTPEYSIDCALSQLTITTPLGMQYSINGGPFQSSPVFTSITNGSYFLTARNVQGCQTSTGIFAVSCGCQTPPVITLTSTSDSTCGTTPKTVSGNIFGGSATSVTLTENGAGTVTPSSSTVSPFSFTYTPGTADRGRIVTITVTSNNPLGTPCTPAIATYTLTVNAVPSAPVIGSITSPTCTSNTGSVVLNGLPSNGTWTLTRHPDEVVTQSEGTTTTVTGLPAGTFTFTVTSAEGCSSAESAGAVVSPPPGSPPAPVIGAITQPDCATSTGSVALSGLPASVTWTLTRLPGGSTRTGTGTTVIATTIPGGTYTYTVTNNSTGCSSAPSLPFIVKQQPPTPARPSIGQITGPKCNEATGSVALLGLPASGNWILTRYSGGDTTKGSGTSHTVSGIPPGTYNYTVTNSDTCTSSPSLNVVMPAKPPTPTAPVIGTVTQPTHTVPTGSVVLNGLPSGAWILTRLPDNVTTANSGTTFKVTGLAGGLYSFTVTNSYGCVSDTSLDVTISTPGPPKLIITDPPAGCSPGKVDLTAASITEGSTTGLIFSYWLDPDTTQRYATPTTADAGTYYIKGTTVSGFSNIKPVIATIELPPVANAGPDQALSAATSTTMAAVLAESETGVWSVQSGAGVFADVNNPTTEVSNLKQGNNILRWVVTKGVCPADTGRVLIIVGDLTIPTLITPNGDSNNEYFVIRGLESLGTTELVIFDRRGAVLFKNSKYDNKWNGVDYNENPLPNDTYFYRLKSSKGRTVSGYIVIRR